MTDVLTAPPVSSPAPRHLRQHSRRTRDDAAGVLVSFPELVWAHFLWRRQLAALAVDAHQLTFDVPLGASYRRLLHEFQREHGLIVQAYWCSTTASAAAITADHTSTFQRLILRREYNFRFHAATDWQTANVPSSATLIQECETLAIRVTEVLRGTSQWIALRWIMSVSSYLLGRTDAPSPRRISGRNRRPYDRAEEHAQQALGLIEGYYLNAARKSARMVYVWGMLQGISLLAIVPMLIATYLLGFDIQRVHDADTQQVITSYMAGAVGALISVMVRMNDANESASRRFSIDSEIGRRAVRRLGAFRVVVGAIFATAIYAALRGGLLQVSVPAGGRAIYFYAFISFIAGFSERWAQVVLGGAEQLLVTPAHPDDRSHTREANTGPVGEAAPEPARTAR